MLPLNKKNSKSNSLSYRLYSLNNSKKTDYKIKETESGFRYELKIPGYIEEDFNFYRSKNNLVITTDKGCTNTSNNKMGHSYCYPSAYFKMNIPLPNKFLKNEITFNYKDEVLHFDLFKSE